MLIWTTLLGLCSVAGAASPDLSQLMIDAGEVSLEPTLFLGLNHVPAEFDFRSVQAALVETEPADAAENDVTWVPKKLPSPEPPVIILLITGLGFLALAALLRKLPAILRNMAREPHHIRRRRVKVEFRMMS